jgi:hypothetical protein
MRLLNATHHSRPRRKQVRAGAFSIEQIGMRHEEQGRPCIRRHRKVFTASKFSFFVSVMSEDRALGMKAEKVVELRKPEEARSKDEGGVGRMKEEME